MASWFFTSKKLPELTSKKAQMILLCISLAPNRIRMENNENLFRSTVKKCSFVKINFLAKMGSSKTCHGSLRTSSDSTNNFCLASCDNVKLPT